MKPERPKSPRQAREVPIFALSMDDIATSMGVSKPITYGLVERGMLRTFVIGKRRLATPRAVAECVEALEAAGAPLPNETPHNRRAVAGA